MVSGVHQDNAKTIRAIKRNLKRDKRASAALADFVEVLFGLGATEDLDRLTVSELAEIAGSVFAVVKARQPGAARIHIANTDFTSLDETAVTTLVIVNDNMPFILDSLMELFQERGLNVRLVLHPIIAVSRDAKGRMRMSGEADATARESVIYVQVDRLDAKEDLARLEAEIRDVLGHVRLAVDDWQPMRARLGAAIDEFKTNPPPIPVAEIAEAVQFLQWVLENNFTLLGMREYDLVDAKGKSSMSRVDESGLGILRDPNVSVLRRGGELVTITPEIREFLTQSTPLIVTKANVRSRVHRRSHMDYIGVKTFGADGAMRSELRIVGLFTSTAYTKSVQTIPFIRRKVDQVVREAGVDPAGHSGKALLNVLENYPRDEMFQIDWKTLYDFSFAVAMLGERPRIRVLARPDKFDRFVSILVFVPRDRFNTDVRIAIGNCLAEAYEGRLSAYYPSYPEGPLVRVHYIVGRDAGTTPVLAQALLEAAVTEIVRTWDDRLRNALATARDPSEARTLFSRYVDGISEAYKEAFPPEIAVSDIGMIERLNAERPLAIRFQDGAAGEPDMINLKIYHFGAPIPLSDRMPIIENMGFRAINERTYSIDRHAAEVSETVWLHDIALTRAAGGAINLAVLKDRLEAAFMAVWLGRAEDDGYAALTLNAGIPWRDVAFLRALSRYLRQARLPYSQDYMWQTMNTHHGLASKIVDLFHVRFGLDGGKKRDAAEAAIITDIEAALQDVSSLDEDQIIRRFLNLVRAMVRTNMFQIDQAGQPKETFAFKFIPAEIESLPEPRPYREIFVYSPRVEGVHLRFGPIARGGLRWSDRPQDFRTEVLGLVKAQQVKNAVIVPVGAKGGFLPKKLPVGGSRDAWFNEGREAYKIFIASLLDVTDNLDGENILPPDNVTRREGDDPYLVVAADKGTATFSDTANGISQSVGFWLDDAFASGGSAGYDHKKMGITARGGWEAVKRHFREIDTDIQSEPFTVIGCGDMSGDVFGNGMLLSRHIKLLCAFDHRDIFIDPNPDPAKSFKERQRLFDLGRSSWRDYNKKLISKGGGVLSRSQKSLTLTPEMQKATGVRKTKVSPFELINAILKMDADLLWFGGIGTYIRAPQESDDMVGDRANDPVRITSDELRVKVVGEGANLGMTQKARIAFALKGGRVNSDAIDNSAGVNSSDVEVNIKIALGKAVRDGRLTTPARNTLLASMTDEVADLVLRNNYLQTLALSLMQRKGLSEIEFQARFMDDLENRGLLDRDVEDLPDAIALQERIDSGKALSRPELAVLLAYAKITLFDNLLGTRVPDDPYLARELMRYFPTRMKKAYADTIEGHRLRREIIATLLANSMINRGGATFVDRIADQTGAGVETIASAFALARDSYGTTALNGEIDALDNVVPGDLQLELYSRVQDTTVRQTLWFVRNVDAAGDLESQVSRFNGGLAKLARTLGTGLPESIATARGADIAALAAAGVPGGLCEKLANLPYLAAGPDIIRVSEESGSTVNAAAKVYYAIGSHFGADRLARASAQLDLGDYYDRVAMNGALDGVAEAQRRIALVVLGSAKGRNAVGQWIANGGEKIDRTRRAVLDIADDPYLTVSKMSVASSLLRDLVPA